jgi:hypothetical protein
MRISLWRVTVGSPTASSSSCLLGLRHGRGASLFDLQILGSLANFRRLIWMSVSLPRVSSTQKFRCPKHFLIRNGPVQTGVRFHETPGFLAGLWTYTVSPSLSVLALALWSYYRLLRAYDRRMFSRTVLLARWRADCRFLSLPASSNRCVSGDSFALRWWEFGTFISRPCRRKKGECRDTV